MAQRTSRTTTRDKHQFAKLTKGKFETNTLVELPAAAASDPLDFQKADGLYSPDANSIPVLQRRGVIFIGRHNEVPSLGYCRS